MSLVSDTPASKSSPSSEEGDIQPSGLGHRHREVTRERGPEGAGLGGSVGIKPANSGETAPQEEELERSFGVLEGGQRVEG